MERKYTITRNGTEAVLTDDREEAAELYDAIRTEFPSELVILWARRTGWNAGDGYGDEYGYEWRSSEREGSYR